MLVEYAIYTSDVVWTNYLINMEFWYLVTEWLPFSHAKKKTAYTKLSAYTIK